jgi:hypothetical protein
MPVAGPRRPIHWTSVPVKVTVAPAPAAAGETAAVVPLQELLDVSPCVQLPVYTPDVCSTRVPVIGGGNAGATSKASTTTA